MNIRQALTSEKQFANLRRGSNPQLSDDRWEVEVEKVSSSIPIWGWDVRQPFFLRLPLNERSSIIQDISRFPQFLHISHIDSLSYLDRQDNLHTQFSIIRRNAPKILPRANNRNVPPISFSPRLCGPCSFSEFGQRSGIHFAFSSSK